MTKPLKKKKKPTKPLKKKKKPTKPTQRKDHRSELLGENGKRGKGYVGGGEEKEIRSRCTRMVGKKERKKKKNRGRGYTTGREGE